jgi:hypothetical protein
MILFSKVRKVLLSIGMVFLISTAIVFSFASGESWAATSSMQGTQTQIATINQQAKDLINNVKDQAKEAIANIKDDLKTDAVQNDQQFDANTQQLIVDSIKNPDYNPGGKTSAAAEQSCGAIKCLESDVRDVFNNTSGSLR